MKPLRHFNPFFIVMTLFTTLLSGCGPPVDPLANDPTRISAQTSAPAPIGTPETPTTTGPELDQTQRTITDAFLPAYPPPTINPAFMYPPPIARPTEAMPTSAVSQRSGILYDCENTFMHLIQQKNCWVGKRDGQSIGVIAGSSRTESSIGQICIIVPGNDAAPTITCQRIVGSGSLEIMREWELVLHLRAEDGRQFTLDVRTAIFSVAPGSDSPTMILPTTTVVLAP